MHLYKTSLLFLIYGNCCMLQKKWPILYIYFSFLFSFIYIINYYIDRKNLQQSATNNLKPLVLLRLPCCRNCCKLLHLLQKLVAETVALSVTSCCKLLHLPFIVSCNNLQQAIFIIFSFLQQKMCNSCNTSATVSATHIYSRT